jgi:hypothetical protein
VQCGECKEKYSRYKFKLPNHKCYFKVRDEADTSSEIEFLKDIIRKKDIEIKKLNELYCTRDILTDKIQKNVQGNFKCNKCARFTVEPVNLFLCKNSDCFSKKREAESPRNAQAEMI